MRNRFVTLLFMSRRKAPTRRKRFGAGLRVAPFTSSEKHVAGGNRASCALILIQQQITIIINPDETPANRTVRKVDGDMFADTAGGGTPASHDAGNAPARVPIPSTSAVSRKRWANNSSGEQDAPCSESMVTG